MRQMLSKIALCLALTAPAPAYAETCFADYKAKQANPLRLHYGVMQLQGPCRKNAARAEVSARLAAQKSIVPIKVYDRPTDRDESGAEQ